MPFKHANDPAMANLGYPRTLLDHYPTPLNVTYALVPFLRRHYAEGEIWEPACGNGAIVNVLSASGYSVRATDIRDWGCPEYRPLDFLRTHETHACVVTNPPYEQAEEFVQQAMILTQPTQGVAALLLRHEYDCAAGRIALFNRPPFARKVVLTFRPRWIADSTGAPRHNYAWYIWDWKWTGDPVLSYAQRPF